MGDGAGSLDGGDPREEDRRRMTGGSRFRRTVAAARRLNRRPDLVEATRRRRQGLLGEEPEGLAHRLDGHPSELAARRLALLRGDRPGVVGELGVTALQAWQRLAESQARGRGDTDVVILFTDLVGFSSWALEVGDVTALRLLRELADAIEPPILRRRGEVVKRLGDGLMAAFGSAPEAFDAALVINERAAAIDLDGYRPHLRTSAGPARSPRTTWESTSTSPPAWSTPPGPTRSSSPRSPSPSWTRRRSRRSGAASTPRAPPPS
jgi:class 3 adenylate cyclase